MRITPIFRLSFRISILLPVFLLVLSGLLSEVETSQFRYDIAEFEPDDKGRLPDGWGLHNGDRDGVYRVEVGPEGNAYLCAEQGPESAVRTGTEARYNLKDYPILSWKWRVHDIPDGAREDVTKLNDSAAGVYVVFKTSLFRPLPKVLKYVWSSTLEKGAEIQSPSTSRMNVVIRQSGMPDSEGWVTETTNAYEDYKRLFGKEPPEVMCIAVMTDADDTETFSAADYDDFRILKAEAVN